MFSSVLWLEQWILDAGQHGRLSWRKDIQQQRQQQQRVRKVEGTPLSAVNLTLPLVSAQRRR
jgi:hypothetical protein